MSKYMFFQIIEVAYVHQVLYNGGDGSHFKVSYLVDNGGAETVVEVLPTSKEDLLQLPEITPETVVTVMTESGSPVYSFPFKDL